MKAIFNIQPRYLCLGLAALAAASLASVFIGQYFFGLHPCHLCLIQRWPFAIVIAAGLVGFVAANLSLLAIGASALAFLTNAGIAVYHSGIERKWWTGLEGCSAPDLTGSIEELMARIETAAVTRCDEIPWSFLGLSLANYNVLLCLGGGLGSLYYLWGLRGRKSA